MNRLPPYRPVEPETETVDPEVEQARRVCRRMQALLRALEDMPAQAMRLLRAMEKRNAAPAGPKRYGPVRSGTPPGYRANRTHEVDEILYECHFMAWADRPPPDI